MMKGCHCERSAAIHAGMKPWIATAFGLAMTRWRGFAMTGWRGLAMTRWGRGLAMMKGCHCERSAAIHAGMKPWIATAFGLAMTTCDKEGNWGSHDLWKSLMRLRHWAQGAMLAT